MPPVWRSPGILPVSKSLWTLVSLVIGLNRLMRTMDVRFSLFAFIIVSSSNLVSSDTLLSKVDRRIDLTSEAVRITSTIKVENVGDDVISKFLLTFHDRHVRKMAYLAGRISKGKGKAADSGLSLPIEITNSEGMPPHLTFYSVRLPKSLGRGEGITVDILVVLTHSLQSMPEKISQADAQLFVFEDSAHYLSVYPVKSQSLIIKIPDGRLESYTKVEKTKFYGSEMKYGSYENVPPFSHAPIMLHFENNQPFAVAEELVREIEISHWGNVEVTEHYNLIHGGAQMRGEFSRLDYQAKPDLRGASAIEDLVAKLPRNAHSIYYRDEIGNVSTSDVLVDSRKLELRIQPRYPLFGNWRISFTIGYGLPLHEFLFYTQGKYVLNITFGCPFDKVIVDHLIVKVVLPEKSWDASVSVPFRVRESQERKVSHLDTVGRPVIVLEKANVVREHSREHFQVEYRFRLLSLLREPFMLVSGFLFLFAAFIAYSRADLSISKSSDAYAARQHREELEAVAAEVDSIAGKCARFRADLDGSLQELRRTGDVPSCKAARRSVDCALKDLLKQQRRQLQALSFSPAARLLVQDLVAKETELQEKLMLVHSAVLDSFEQKHSSPRDLEKRIAPLQRSIATLQADVHLLIQALQSYI